MNWERPIIFGSQYNYNILLAASVDPIKIFVEKSRNENDNQKKKIIIKSSCCAYMFQFNWIKNKITKSAKFGVTVQFFFEYFIAVFIPKCVYNNFPLVCFFLVLLLLFVSFTYSVLFDKRKIQPFFHLNQMNRQRK